MPGVLAYAIAAAAGQEFPRLGSIRVRSVSASDTAARSGRPGPGIGDRQHFFDRPDARDRLRGERKDQNRTGASGAVQGDGPTF